MMGEVGHRDAPQMQNSPFRRALSKKGLKSFAKIFRVYGLQKERIEPSVTQRDIE